MRVVFSSACLVSDLFFPSLLLVILNSTIPSSVLSHPPSSIVLRCLRHHCCSRHSLGSFVSLRSPLLASFGRISTLSILAPSRSGRDRKGLSYWLTLSWSLPLNVTPTFDLTRTLGQSTRDIALFAPFRLSLSATTLASPFGIPFFRVDSDHLSASSPSSSISNTVGLVVLLRKSKLLVSLLFWTSIDPIFLTAHAHAFSLPRFPSHPFREGGLYRNPTVPSLTLLSTLAS